MKKFLYLVQCRESLPESLTDLRSNESDVIFLSWRKPTKDGIFFPFSTYNQGRNRLFEEAVRRDYLYYIFMDEDAKLETTPFCKTPDRHPWRVFEQYLLDYEPAVGVAWGSWQIQNPVEVEAIDFFDLVLNAIHREAINTLLPYDESSDKKSWWCSTLYVNHLAYLLYPGYILQFNALKVENTAHMPYPRGKSYWDEVDKTFEQGIINNELKMKFHPFLSEFQRYPVKKKDKSYFIKIEEIKELFNANTSYWRHRLKCTNINRKHAGLSYFAESLHKRFGPHIAKLIFEIPLALKELYTRMFFPWKHWQQDYAPFKHLLKGVYLRILVVTGPVRRILGIRKSEIRKIKEKIINFCKLRMTKRPHIRK